MTGKQVEIAIVGAGIAGIAAAYYLCVKHGKKSLLLIDSRQPMSFTSAQSGDNFRNWWPHPTMYEFTNTSIDLMDALAAESNNVFNMKQTGYVLATRRDDIDELTANLGAGYGEASADVDIVGDEFDLQASYPALSREIRNVIHIRRGGDIAGQQLGQYMLEQVREAGGRRLGGEVRAISANGGFSLDVVTADGPATVTADIVVNAAGPFSTKVAGMLGVDLPITNTFQQKIAFEDVIGAVPRDMPFSIDLDEKQLNWTDEEREMLADDPDLAWLAENMPGGTHCRPEGATKWVKLGWAYNSDISEPQEDLANEPRLDGQFPEIVIRGAAAFIPSLTPYIEAPPVRFSHYGGYYSMTEENWPLIGPLGVDGAFTISALSGFGSMAACAAGSLCANWIDGGPLPSYAKDLSPARYDDAVLIDQLRRASNKGLL